MIWKNYIYNEVVSMSLKWKKRTPIVNPNRRPMSVDHESDLEKVRKMNEKALRLLAKLGY